MYFFCIIEIYLKKERSMRIIITLIFYFLCLPTFSLENIFYVLHDNHEAAMRDIANNHTVVNKIIAQSYQIDRNGKLTGSLDPLVLQTAKAYTIPVYAMVTNAGFDASIAHQFLLDPTAQKNALDQLILECKKNNIAGVQFDFEMIHLKDRDLLTAFYQKAADMLHTAGLQVSFAVAPVTADSNFKTNYQKKLYQVWQGAYDLEKLGKVADFITVMSYDQHAEGTTPGAIASIPWAIDVLQYALRFVPITKISFGIPTYSGLWYMAMNKAGRVTIHYDAVSYKTVQYILQKNNLFLHWDDVNQVNYSFFDANGVNKYLFIENQKSFQAKYELALKYHLTSVSIFRLGIEDPGIWEILKKP